MLKSGLLAYTATSRSATSIKEAKTKQHIFGIADALTKAEETLVAKARELDEGSKDFAKDQKDMVVLTANVNGRNGGAFLANLNEDSYTLESNLTDYYGKDQESLRITKEGDKTIYRLKRESYSNQFQLPDDALNILMTREDQGEGKPPKITLIEGAVSIALHSAAGAIGGLFTGLSKVSVKFG